MTNRLVALAALLLIGWGGPEPLLAQAVPGAAASTPAVSISLLAQESWPNYPAMGGEHDIVRGPGGYFSWIKLLLIVAVFFFWLRMADWVNRDAIRFGEFTGLPAEVWNPLVVFAFVAGFFAVLSIPSFIAGFPVYVVAAVLPWAIYMMQRRGQIPDEARTGQLFSGTVAENTVPIEIRAAGASGDAQQANLIRARQSPAFETTCQMLLDAFENRTEQFLLDFTREAVAQRVQIDGIWHQMPTLDRETGDGVLWVLKTLAGLNPAERRQAQKGMFNGKVGREKVEFDVASQGVQTGERVLIKLTRESVLKLELPALGMTSEISQALLDRISASGLIVISAPPGHGLSSTWQAVLNGADRFTRDFVGIADPSDRETERENIEIRRLNLAAGENPAPLLKKMILKQPNAFVFPDAVNAETLDLLTDQVNRENRTVLTRVQAGSAVEALLRMMALSGDRGQFVKSVTAVTCQRLVRRLCDTCKQPVPANPRAIQQMGGNPQVDTVLYRDYQLPPPEQRVDEQGKPVEMQPCAACSGIGFVGRTAIYELLLVNPAIRDALQKSPKPDVVGQVARQQGNLTIIQQAWRAVLDGRTSMAEVQRVLQGKK